MSRNDTNLLIKAISENAHREDYYPDFYVTVGVGGSVITGTAISEEEFFELEENSLWKEFFYSHIKEPREEIIKKLDDGEEIKFPDSLKEHFLYLKDAKYIQNSKLFPVAGRPLSIQIRVSDISTLSLVEFCQGKPADEQNP